jgi:uncharacterized protein YcaQ
MRTLTREEARRIVVSAALLDANRPGDVVEVVEQIGKLKIDPTAVIVNSEHAMLWARIGWNYEPSQLKKAVETDRLIYEFDGEYHAASRIPFLWPVLRNRTLGSQARGWLDANLAFRDHVLKRLSEDGPLLASEIEDTHQVAHKSESGWYGSNQVPRMLDLLGRMGQVAVSGRQGRMRVWDLAERVYPANMPEYSIEEAELGLEELRLKATGITRHNAAYSRIKTAGELVAVEGNKSKWRVDPEALAALEEDPGGRVAILNPYDGVLFDRTRLRDLFDFDYVLEQFKPKAQRIYGYFAHPILVGDRFIGLLDAALDKAKETLVVGAIHELVPFDEEETEMVHAEIRELAGWLQVGLAGMP